MTELEKRFALLEELRTNPEKYLPLVDHAWQYFPDRDDGENAYDDPEHNIGWNVGMLEGNRPWFLECWATCGITLLTYFIPTAGIETCSRDDLIALLEGAKLFRILDPQNPRTETRKCEDSHGNEFFSVNIVVGDEEGTYVEGGKIFPFPALNDFNRGNGSRIK